jgi:hypothetical protein
VKQRRKLRQFIIHRRQKVSGRPDWANFRLFGDWLLCAVVFLNYKSSPNFRASFYPRWNYVLILRTKLATFWAIFSQTHLVTQARFFGKAMHWLLWGQPSPGLPDGF